MMSFICFVVIVKYRQNAELLQGFFNLCARLKLFFYLQADGFIHLFNVCALQRIYCMLFTP